MINAVSTKQQYCAKTMPKQYTKTLEKENVQQKKSDMYIPSKTVAEGNESGKTEQKELYYGLEQQQWKEIASKYDVENLSEEQRKNLLEELKEKGVLNEQEYRTTKFVFIPLEECFLKNGEVAEGGKITIGEQKAYQFEQKNWIEKYDAIANYCDSLLDTLTDDSRKQSIENIRNAYLKIADIFDKIAEERKTILFSEKGEME